MDTFEWNNDKIGGAAGTTVTREDKVKQILDEIIEKLPEEFNMVEIMNKVEERTPYVIAIAVSYPKSFNHYNFVSRKISRILHFS